MLKPQTKIKQKGPRLLNQSDFSKKKLIVFAATFAFIGVYLIWRTFAISPTIGCVRLSGEVCFNSPNSIVCNEISKTGTASGYTNDTTPTFAIDTDGPSAKYQYSIDGVLQGTFTAGALGPLSIACTTSTSPISDGHHTFTANELEPDSTKTTLPNPYNFTVDTIAPTASSTPALDFAYETGVPGDNITSASTPRFNGTGEPLGLVELYHQGKTTPDNTGATDSAGKWDIGTPALAPDGVYSFYAKSVDNAGNYSPASGLRTITIDTTQPDAVLSVPTTISNSATLQVKDSNGNNASDNLSGMWKVWYRFRPNNTAPWTDIGTTTTAPYSLNWDTSSLANGTTYTVRAFAYDVAGNFKMTDTSVTVANTTPLVNITNPSNNDFVKGSVAVTASATANATGAIISKVEFYVDGSLKATDTSPPFTFNWNASSLSGGHNLVAKAYDNASPANIATSSTVSVTVDNVAPSKPTFVAAKPAPFTQMYVSWTQATDNIGIDYYDVWADGEQNNTVSPDECVGSSCSVFFDFNEAGVSHSFYVKAVDFAGNINTSTTVSGTTSDDINVSYLDDGTCGRDVRKNSDPNTTNATNPDFYATGDGTNATYSLEVDHWIGNTGQTETIYDGGTSTNIGNSKYCLSLPSNINLVNGETYSMFANEVSPIPGFGATGVVFTVSTTAVPGDANGDGHVTIIDLSILLSNFSSTSNLAADFNHDGIVNIIDLSILLSHFGS